MRKTISEHLTDYFYPVFEKISYLGEIWVKIRPFHLFWVVDCLIFSLEMERIPPTHQKEMIDLAKRLATILTEHDSRLQPLFEMRFRRLKDED